MDSRDRVIAAYEQRFGAAPALVARAPGRVNVIGEHTDYNGGWVLPAAISLGVHVAAAPRMDDMVQIVALDLAQEATVALADREPPQALWLRYPQGIAIALQEAGHRLRGMNAVYAGDVPIGAGLSSSAAVELAFAVAYSEAANLTLTPLELAEAAHRAETGFVGVACGVMDQFIAALGRKGNALLLNCASLEYRSVPIALPEMAIVVMDSGVRRELAASKYGLRRAECEAALRRLQTRLPQAATLSQITPEALAVNRDLLSPLLLRRARHVAEENARTLAAAAALAIGDADRVGDLMRASHASLRELYEVSSPELDALVDIANTVAGVVGARMTGAGFGGCAIALVRQAAVPALREAIASEYPARAGRRAAVFVVTTADGAGVKRV